MANYNPKLRREAFRSQVTSRTVSRRPLIDDPIHGPTAHNACTRAPMARTPASVAAQARRTVMLRRGVILLVGILCVVLLCSAAASVALKVVRAFQPGSAANPAGALNGSQNGWGLPAAAAAKVNILLLGTDQRPDDSGYRTDVIILVAIDPARMTVSAVSFPRDLWVKVPGMDDMKINSVMQLGGFESMAKMFQANFGVKPDYYMQTNFAGFVQFINSRGGVAVDVGKELTDTCDLPQAVDGSCKVRPGIVQMDGATALWYVRSQETSSDFDRLRRAQEVVIAAAKKVINIKSITKLKSIKTALQDNVQTNLSVEKVLSLLPTAAHLLQTPESIHGFAITEEQATPSWSWNGMWILLPDPAAIDGLLKQAGMK